MPPKWASCIVCGNSYPGMTTDTCSQECTRKLQSSRSTGQKDEPVADKYGGWAAKGKQPARRSPDKKPGGCSTVLLPPAVGFAAVVLALARRGRR